MSPRALAIIAGVAVVVFMFDRITKILVVENLPLNTPTPFIGELLRLRFVENPGAAFGLGGGMTWIFAIIASAVVVFLVIFARRIRSLGWAVVFGLLLGGVLGNLFDRLTRGGENFGQGHVIDFLELWGFPAIFNIADVGIVSSMALFIILTLRGIALDGTRHTKETASQQTPTATESD